jgi:trehalose 6-phosphate phosphatase
VVLALAAQTAAGAVLVAGDDTGDLPAFAAVRTLAAAGTPGCAVAVAGPGADPRVAAAADLVVDGPVALVEFVGGLVEPG